MASCWLIEFQGGRRIIISEEMYAKEKQRDWNGRKRVVEEHWFDLLLCKARNQGIIYYEKL